MDCISLQAVAESSSAGRTWLYVGLFFAGVLLLGLLLIAAKALRSRFQRKMPTGFTHEDLESIRDQLSDEEFSRLKRALVGVNDPEKDKKPQVIKSDSELSTSGENDDAIMEGEG